MFHVQSTEPPVERFYCVGLETLTSGGRVYLGDAIRWIASRGNSVSATELAQRWDDIERELFCKLDLATNSQGIVVEGFPEGGMDILEPLPNNIWSTMNTQSPLVVSSPHFVSCDDKREFGGRVYVGTKCWNGVSVSTAFILLNWPPTGVRIEMPEKRRKRSAQQERVRPVLRQLYPDGVPERSEISDGQLYSVVAKHMEDAAKAGVRMEGAPSRETVLRAAGRK